MTGAMTTSIRSTEPWITTKEAAEHLGVPESFIYQRADELGLPRRALGRHYRYRRSELDAWLDGRTEPALPR
jgi:excisionase family DNA binding protein